MQHQSGRRRPRPQRERRVIPSSHVGHRLPLPRSLEPEHTSSACPEEEYGHWPPPKWRRQQRASLAKPGLLRIRARAELFAPAVHASKTGLHAPAACRKPKTARALADVRHDVARACPEGVVRPRTRGRGCIPRVIRRARRDACTTHCLWASASDPSGLRSRRHQSL